MENQPKVITFGALGKYDNLRPQVKPVKATYEEMTEMRDQGKLIPGQLYRITDYVTTTAQAETQSAGHPFDIIVMATAADALSEDALAVRHEGDTYFKDANIEAWRLKYTLDNDYDRFAWCQRESIVISNQEYLRSESDDVSGANYPYCWKHDNTKRYTNTLTPTAGTDVAKGNTAGTGTNYQIQTVNHIDGTQRGVIYWMQDEWGNECPYDFKNIMFKRYKITATSKIVEGQEVLADLKDTYLGFRQLVQNGTGQLYPQNCTMSTSDTRWSFALSLNGTQDLTLQVGHHCTGNVVEPCFFGSKQYLNNVTLQATGSTDDSYNNHIDGTSHSISMGSGCYNNTLTQGSHSCTLSSNSYNNTLSSSGSNTLSSDSSYNTLSSSYNNTLSSSESNTLSSSWYNTLSSSYNNTLSSSGSNTLSSSNRNTLSSSSNNTLSSDSSYNTLSSSYNNTLSINSYNNTLSSNFFAELIGCYNAVLPEGSAYEQGIGGYMVEDGLYIKNYGQRRTVQVLLASMEDEDNPVLNETITLEAGQVYYRADTYFEPSESSQMTFTEGGKTHKYGFSYY